MIYKPTDLSPSAQTFDVMDTPIFFECKVDTSNVQASGFTIEILDSENNVVFSSIPKGEQLNINYITIIDDLREYVHTYFTDYETGYSLLNTGYNGSYLKFPFSVAYDSRANNTSAINQIFYIPDPNGIVVGLTEDEIKISSGLYQYNYIWTTGNNPEYIIDTNKPLIPVKIYNGKEYKWSITLYQLENVGTTKNPVWILPENPLMFDMPMTTGTVLGSNNKRIQSAFSEEIYGDYFIQPLKIENLIYNHDDLKSWYYSGSIEQIGTRTMIKSYDMSFGYIYPTEGDNGIPEANIVPGQANAFRIYKNGNSPENLTAYQKVNFMANKPLDSYIATEWNNNASYTIGDVVLYNNNIYQCILGYNVDQISTIPGKNNIYWEKVSQDKVKIWDDGEELEYCSYNHDIYKRNTDIPYIAPAIEYNNQTIYEVGDVIYFDSDKTDSKTEKYYKCIKTTTAGIPTSNAEYWQEINAYWSDNNVGNISDYNTNTSYVQGNVVKSGEKYYAYINTSSSKGEDLTNKDYWAEIPIFNWFSNYSIDNVVIYTDKNKTGAYKCIRNINQTPTNGSNFWSLISYKNIDYEIDSIVGYIDYLYRCKKDYSIKDPTLNPIPSLYGQYDENNNHNGSLYWSLYNGQVWEWVSSLANPGESYGTFTYYSSTKPNGVYTLPDEIMPTSLIGGERIVLNNQETNAVYNNGEYLGSPYNGIYNVDISSQVSSEEYKNENIYFEGNIVTYEGYEYYCTGVVIGSKPGETPNWPKYWMGIQPDSNATNYDANRNYKKGDIVQVEVGSDENGKIYSYYACLGVVSGQTPPSNGEPSVYWVKNNRNGYRVTIRFNRAPDADSWGELMTKIVYVSNGNQFYGKNIQIKASNDDGIIDTSDVYGVINQTPFKFIEEEPIQIYKYEPSAANPYRNTIGLILYNNPVTTSNKNGILYIRYFEGIQKGMMLQKLSSDNKYNYFIIDDVGTNGGMYLKYHEVKEFDTYKPYTTSDAVANANPTTLTADTTWDIDETKYQIKTYFRESDENAFYFYSRPVVDIQFESTAGVNFVTGRTPYVAATLWEAGRTYSKGDYVYVDSNTRKYFLCLSEDGVSSDIAPSTTNENWELLTTGINIYKNNVNYKKDTIVSYNNVYYIALTNISQNVAPVAPEGKNLGIFWETYVGTLYKEDRGFDYSLYNNLKAYKAGDIVFDQGIYYIALADIKSKIPTENTNLWGLFTDISDEVVYPYEYFGFYNGKYYQCINKGGSNGFISSNWALVTGVNGDEQYKDGLRVNINDLPYTNFISSEVYTVERTVFYDGLKYQVRVLQFNENTNYYPGEYVMTGEQYNPKYYLCTNEIIGADKDPSKDTAHWREVDIVDTAPLLENTQYYEEYDNWKSTKLYNEGELVLYNNKYYVYINDNRNKKNIYRTELSYNVGDLAKIQDGDDVYKWKYCKIANPQGQLIINNWVDIIPDSIDGTYNSNEFWIEYYGFLYVGDYGKNTYTANGNVKSYVNYYYNNVVYYNNQYYIYQNPNLNGVSLENFRGPNINTSLDRLNNNILKYKAGEPGYKVGDIVLYDNKYYICYKATTEAHFSPANRSYWTLYPWQTFITEISERTVVCNGEYSQQQYIQWKSVQWFLYDATGENIIDKSDVIYDGDLTYTFHGVDGREKGKQDDVIFIVRLVLETRTGYRLTIDKKIKAIYEIEEINSQGLIDAYFDCDTMSVITVITKESGFIIPTLEGDGTVVTYAEGDSNGEMTVDGEVDYAKVLYSLESASAVASAADIISDSERFELQSSQKIDTDYFSGYITRIQTAVDSSDEAKWNTQGSFGILIPEMLQGEDSVSSDDFNKHKNILKLNPERNTIYWEAKDVNNGSYYMSPVVIMKNNDDGGILSEDDGNILSKYGILTDVYKNSVYETASNYQPKNFISIYRVTLAKDDSRNKYPNTNYLPITYATYFTDEYMNLYNAEYINNSGTIINMKFLEYYEGGSFSAKYDNNKWYNATYIDGEWKIGNELDENVITSLKIENIANIVGSKKNGDIINIYKPNKYNAETPYNVYDTKTFKLPDNKISMDIKRIQSPLVSRNNFSTSASNNANKFDVTGFNVDRNDSDISKLKTEVYLAEMAPTLISDYTYSETYGIPEGLKYESEIPITYYRQKNVINDFSEVWKEAGDDEIEFSYWKDGEYIINGSSLQGEVLGSISINNDARNTINIFGDGDAAIFSNTMLFLQERLKEIVSERSYLNGKKFIISADLVMDGNGGLTPYPGDTDEAERVVIYTDSDIDTK